MGTTRVAAIRRVAVLACVGLLLVGGCASTTADPTEQQLGQQLVAATQEAGVAPGLTPEVAASLYGTDAPHVCGIFEGGLGDASDIMLLGNPAQGRRKNITDDAVVYAGSVVATYCPQVRAEFDEAVTNLAPVGTRD